MANSSSPLSETLPPATHWRLRTRTLSFGPLPRLMGIVNVTPDSFSDGGRFLARDAAVQHALRLLDEGADILDVGGESTRPYATPVAADEELRRVLPVIEAVLKNRPAAILSIDTSKAAVARAALAAGAEIINDITGLTGDPAMLAVALETGSAVCVMHMQGTPQTMQLAPAYTDVVAESHTYLRLRRDTLTAAGLDPARICLDPGLGFGKTHEHNITLLRNAFRFLDLGCPLLIGHSRKGFLGKLLGDKTADRTYATLGASLSLALQHIPLLRLHDIAPTKQALLAFDFPQLAIDHRPSSANRAPIEPS
jgi:dihydropteroate synthase